MTTYKLVEAFKNTAMTDFQDAEKASLEVLVENSHLGRVSARTAHICVCSRKFKH